MEILRSLGLAASITILTALSVNLTLLPALLLVLGPALLAADAWMKRGWARGKAALWGRRGRRKGRRKGAGKGGWEAPLLEGATDKEDKEQRVWKKEEAMEENSEEMDDGGYDCDESAPLKKGCWLGLARLGEGREGTEREVDGSIACSQCVRSPSAGQCRSYSFLSPSYQGSSPTNPTALVPSSSFSPWLFPLRCNSRTWKQAVGGRERKR
jgi:hypothetical protein